MTQMTTRFVALVAGVLAATMITGAAPQKTETAAAMMEAAKQKAEVVGDLPGAIRQYQAIVDRFGKTDRPVAATALLRMAECHQKLGHAQAQRIYEQIVRDYREQQDVVVVARARLGAVVAAPNGIVNRQIWTGKGVDTEGTVSPDGRYLSFVDWETGDLAIRDLSAGTNRRLTNKGTWEQSDDFAEESAISRDGAQVAYAWWDNSRDRYVLRLLRLDGSAPVRTIVDNAEIDWIAPYDWSPDGRSIAVAVARKDRTDQIGLVGIDGTLRVLKSVDFRGTTKLSFSPDGTLLAYDHSVADTSQRDVFVMRVDGSRDTAAVVHRASDAVVGWSPDGRSLLFASDRSGALALWSVPIANGRPAGAVAPTCWPSGDRLTPDRSLPLASTRSCPVARSRTITPSSIAVEALVERR